MDDRARRQQMLLAIEAHDASLWPEPVWPDAAAERIVPPTPYTRRMPRNRVLRAIVQAFAATPPPLA